MLWFTLIAAQVPADIELNIHATVREVRVRQRGETSLEVHASPDANSRVDVGRPAGNRQGRSSGRSVDIHAQARIADPAVNSPPAETSRPK